MSDNSYVPIPVYIKAEPAPEAPEQIPFDKKSASKVFSRIGFAGILFMIVITIAQVAMSIALNIYVSRGGIFPKWLTGSESLLLLTPVYIVGVPVFALVLNGVPTDSRIKERSLPKGILISVFAISVLGMMAGNVVGSLLMEFINDLLPSSAVNALEGMVLDANVWMTILFLCILTPIAEELTFRKLLIDRAAIFGDKTAIVISGLTFGLFHGNLYQFFYAFILGMIFAWVYVRSGKLILPVILHGIINFMGSVIGPAVARNLESTDVSGYTSEEIMNLPPEILMKAGMVWLYSMFIVVAALAGAVLLVVMRRKFVMEAGIVTIPKGSGIKVTIFNAGMAVFIAGCLVMFAWSLLA